MPERIKYILKCCSVQLLIKQSDIKYSLDKLVMDCGNEIKKSIEYQILILKYDIFGLIKTIFKELSK